MKKTTKLLTVICLLLCAVMVVSLVACNDNPETVTYSVTVKDADGKAVSGVSVKWGNYGPKTTDDQGKASIELEAGEYSISLSALPADCTYDAVSATGEQPAVEITLKSTAVPETTGKYTITVKYPDGTPVSGVSVSWCQTKEGGMCFAPNPNFTDENGKIEMTLDLDEYHVQLTKGIPEGYTYDSADNYYTENATAEKRDITITLKADGVMAINAAGAYKVYVEKDAAFVAITFCPTVSGYYSIAATGCTIIQYYAWMGEAPIADLVEYYGESDIYGEIEFLEDQAGEDIRTFYIVPAAGTATPACIDVTVTRTGDVAPVVEARTEEREATEKLAACPDNSNADDQIVYLKSDNGIEKGDDGLYRVDGKVVYVQLGQRKPNSWIDAVTEWINGENPAPYLFYAVDEYGLPDWTLQYNFSKMICGVASYADETPCDSYYGKYLNSDGLYYLTDELKDFLLCWATAQLDNWYSLCCYYGQPAPAIELSVDAATEHTFADYDGVEFTFTATEDGIYSISFAQGDGEQAPISSIRIGDEDGELIFDGYDSTPVDGKYVARFSAMADLPVVLYIVGSPAWDGEANTSVPVTVSFTVAADNALLPNIFNNLVVGTTAFESILAAKSDDYYTIEISGGRMPLDAKITLKIDDKEIALEEECGTYKTAAPLLVAANAKISLVSDDAEGANVVVVFRAALKTGYATNEMRDIWYDQNVIGCDKDQYYDIIIQGAEYKAPKTNITLKVNDEAVALALNESGDQLVARNVFIPAFATIVIESDGEDGEAYLSIILTNRLYVGTEGSTIDSFMGFYGFIGATADGHYDISATSDNLAEGDEIIISVAKEGAEEAAVYTLNAENNYAVSNVEITLDATISINISHEGFDSVSTVLTVVEHTAE